MGRPGGYVALGMHTRGASMHELQRWVRSALVLLAIVGIVAIGFYLGGTPGSPLLTVDTVEGEVTRARNGETQPVVGGMVLADGDRVITGEDGRAVISRDGSNPITLLPGAEVSLLSTNSDVLEMELQRGGLRARVWPDGNALRIRRGNQSVLATDATFGVATTGDDLTVVSEEGSVALSGVTGVSDVSQGQRLHVFADGSHAASSVSTELLLRVDWPKKVVREQAVAVGGTTLPGVAVAVEGPGGRVETVSDGQGAFLLDVPTVEGVQTLEVLASDVLLGTRAAETSLERDTTPPTFELDIDYRR